MNPIPKKHVGDVSEKPKVLSISNNAYVKALTLEDVVSPTSMADVDML